MKDTRETLVENLTKERVPADNERGEDIPEKDRPAPRFKKEDNLIMASNQVHFTLTKEPFWDYEFQGWLVVPGLIGIHESNFILSSEWMDWEAHIDGLWSWWTRKEKESILGMPGENGVTY